MPTLSSNALKLYHADWAIIDFLFTITYGKVEKRNPKGMGAGGSHGITKKKSCDEHFKWEKKGKIRQFL